MPGFPNTSIRRILLTEDPRPESTAQPHPGVKIALEASMKVKWGPHLRGRAEQAGIHWAGSREWEWLPKKPQHREETGRSPQS